MIRQLARAGDTERAWELFTRAGLVAEASHADTLALKGRLFKDRALKASEAERSPLLRAARDAYLHAAEQAPATYPLINAATIALLDGNRAQAAEVAQRVLAMLDSGAHESDTAYWLGATRAEACLLLGRNEDARAALADAVRQAPRAWEDHASTLRHFRLIHEMLGQSDDWLDAYRPPSSLHFSGIIHVAPDHARSAAIADAIETLRPGFAFGALAAGADIMVAELLLENGAELHIALPSTVEAFRRDSVSCFGSEWESRFDAVIESAETIDELDTLDVVSQCGVYVSDEMAMGMAIRQAAMLESSATALRIGEGSRVQGSTLDAAWQKRGLPIHRVPLDRTEPTAGSTLPPFAREAVVARADSTITRFSDPAAAARAALAQVGAGGSTIGIAYGAFDPEEGDDALAETALCIARTAHPGRIPVSRSMALALALEAPDLRCENFGTLASSLGDIALSMLAPA
jgi:tetratricopeptide (TPR) repeat protein